MSRVKNIEASVADMSSKKVTNKPPFPKRKWEVDAVETNSRKREVPPPMPLEKNQLTFVRAWIKDGELILKPLEGNLLWKKEEILNSVCSTGIRSLYS